MKNKIKNEVGMGEELLFSDWSLKSIEESLENAKQIAQNEINRTIMYRLNKLYAKGDKYWKVKNVEYVDLSPICEKCSEYQFYSHYDYCKNDVSIKYYKITFSDYDKDNVIEIVDYSFCYTHMELILCDSITSQNMDYCDDEEIRYDTENELLTFGTKSIKCKTSNFDYYSSSGKLYRFTSNKYKNILDIFAETKNEYDKYPIYKTRKVILLLLHSRIFPKDILLIILKKLWFGFFVFYNCIPLNYDIISCKIIFYFFHYKHFFLILTVKLKKRKYTNC